MIGELFHFNKQRTSERRFFRPVLESLESREVPSSAQVSAAFDQLPADMNNLQASLAARPANAATINTNISAVANDLFTLNLGAAGFTVGDRLRIDSALISDGITLIYDGYYNFAYIPTSQFESVVQLGATALRAGISDFLLTSFYSSTSGDATLT